MPVATTTPNTFNYAQRVQQFLDEMYAKNPTLKRPETNADGTPKAQSQGGSGAGIVGAVAAPIALKAAIKYALKDTKAPAPEVASMTRQPGAQLGQALSGSPTPSVYQGISPSTAPSGLSTPQIVRVGSAKMPDGSVGTKMSDGAVVSESGAIATPDGKIIPAEQSPIGGYIQAAGGAAQAYSGYRQWQDGQRISGGANMLGGAFNAYSGLSQNYQGAAPYVGAAVAAANIGQNMANTEGNSNDRAAMSQAEAAKAALLFIPVYGQAAYAALAAGDALTGGKFTEYGAKGMSKTNHLTDKIDFGLGQSIRSKLFHQNTRGYQKQNTGQLYNKAPEDKAWTDYLGQARKGYGEKQVNPDAPFQTSDGRKYKTWDDYKKGGLEAATLTHGEGALNLFGPEYGHLTEPQRVALTQKFIDADILKNSKGEVQFTNTDTAQQIYDTLKTSNFGMAASGNKPTTGAPLITKPLITQAIARSKTSSPGISKDGKRISYGRK